MRDPNREYIENLLRQVLKSNTGALLLAIECKVLTKSNIQDTVGKDVDALLKNMTTRTLGQIVGAATAAQKWDKRPYPKTTWQKVIKKIEQGNETAPCEILRPLAKAVMIAAIWNYLSAKRAEHDQEIEQVKSERYALKAAA